MLLIDFLISLVIFDSKLLKIVRHIDDGNLELVKEYYFNDLKKVTEYERYINTILEDLFKYRSCKVKNILFIGNLILVEIF